MRKTAIGQQRPGEVIHHTDQGSRYTSLAFGGAARTPACDCPWGRSATPDDNAMYKSFFAKLDCELPDRRRFTSQAEARIACFSFAEGWYSPPRLHAAL